MPLREYICTECAHEQEHLIGLYDTEKPVCCHCDTDTLERLVSVTGGYKMDSGPSSTRPKGAGSRPKSAK